MLSRNQPIAIHQLLDRFEQGDATLVDKVADDIDLRIDHYKDVADTRWQRCTDSAGFIKLLARLATEIFPKGTKIVNLSSLDLNDGWYLSTLDQNFWYGLEQRYVSSRTFIISHELNGQIDYFREHVTTLLGTNEPQLS